MQKESMNRDQRRQISLEKKAYFDGSQDTDLKPGLEEVQGIFDEKSAALSHEAVERQKKQEAVLEHTRTLLPQAESDAAAINQRLNGRRPQWLLPAIVGMASIFMVVAEVVILGPAMDALGISNRIGQFFTATGLVLMSSLLYHFVWETFTNDHFPAAWSRAIRTMAVALTICLILWGVVRGNQVAFAAKLAHNHLDEFLTGNRFLASAFYALLSAIFPIAIGSAIHYAFHNLRDWHDWKTANAKLNNLNQARVNAQKQLDTEREQHQHALRQLAHECAQWKAIYRIHHERGSKHGAIQEPIAMVYIKSAGVALVVGALLFWTPFPLAILAALAAGIGAFQYFRRRREHPTPDQYFDVQHVNFEPRIRNVTPPNEPPLLEASTTPSRRRKGLLK
jgi:hypothetical protein